jgi:hypothetical protein
MSRAGTVGYVEDLLREAALIRSVLGNHLLVAPAPPLFMAGCSCPETVRICVEVAAWASIVYANAEHFLKESFVEALKDLSPGSTADCQVDYCRKLRLPSTTDWPAMRTVWAMQGFRLGLRRPPAGGRLQ